MKRYIKELQAISIYHLLYGKKYQDLNNVKTLEFRGYTISMLCKCFSGTSFRKAESNEYANLFQFWIGIYDNKAKRCLTLEFDVYDNIVEHKKNYISNNYITIEEIIKYIKEYEKEIKQIESDFNTNPQFIHDLYLDVLVKLDEDIKLQKEKDGIDLKRDKKVCLLLSKLIRELYGEEMETDNSYIFGSTKKECFKILKETILPSLDYKIDDGELNEIIDDCARKLSYENKERFEV